MEYEFLVKKEEPMPLAPGNVPVERKELGKEYEVVYVQADDYDINDLLFYPYEAMPKVYSPLSPDWEEAGCIASIQQNPALGLVGEGVILGFIDSGLDITDSNFQFAGGGSRVGIFWNQEDDTVYNRSELNALLSQTRPSEWDETGHGSYLAGIAAGRDGGVALEAELAVVRLKTVRPYLREFYNLPDNGAFYQENDIMAGVAFLDAYAAERGKPLVLCFCLGTNQGEHEGGSYLGEMLSGWMKREDRMVVCGAGNEALRRHHFFSLRPGGVELILHPEENSRAYVMEIRVEEGAKGFYVESYVRIPQQLRVAVISPTGETYDGIPAGERNGYHRFRVEDTQVYQSADNVVGRELNRLVRSFFVDPTPGIWKLVGRIEKITDGEMHSWLPLEEQLQSEVVFIRSDPDTTVTEPGNAPLLLTVAAYDTVTEGIFIESGRGYSKNGIVKPEIAAPGVDLVSPYRQEAKSSTSAAAAVTAGAAALYMEWALNRVMRPRGVDVKERLLSGVRKKENVTYPNREWGYGMLCLRDSFLW